MTLTMVIMVHHDGSAAACPRAWNGMLRHLSQPSGPLEIPDDRGGLGGLRRRIFIALQARKLASLLYWAAVFALGCRASAS